MIITLRIIIKKNTYTYISIVKYWVSQPTIFFYFGICESKIHWLSNVSLRSLFHMGNPCLDVFALGVFLTWVPLKNKLTSLDNLKSYFPYAILMSTRALVVLYTYF